MIFKMPTDYLLPNGQRIYDWQYAAYQAWKSQIDAVKQLQADTKAGEAK